VLESHLYECSLGKQGCFDVLSGGSSLSQHVATESGKIKRQREKPLDL